MENVLLVLVGFILEACFIWLLRINHPPFFARTTLATPKNSAANPAPNLHPPPASFANQWREYHLAREKTLADNLNWQPSINRF